MIFVNKDTLTLFLRNEGVPQEYTMMGLSPLYACIFYLVLTVCNKFHKVHLENLYNSAKCVHLLYTHNNCIMVQGFCQNGSWVIPRGVL